jgi:7-carboxy-7-deazaguanine synthase
MFGNNPVRKQDLESAALWVQEVFPTIQGEGPEAGKSAVFVRLAGCNLRCWFCDTDFESSDWRPDLPALVARIKQEREQVPQSDLIVLTGGEPLRQNILPLISALSAEGFYVQIETAGTLWVPGLEYFVRQRIVEIVCSPKTPHVHPRIEEQCWHYKYIVSASEARDAVDGLPLASTQQRARNDGTDALDIRKPLYRPHPGATIWVQPCEEYDGTFPNKKRTDANLKLCADLAMRHGYRLSLQLHKILGLR